MRILFSPANFWWLASAGFHALALVLGAHGPVATTAGASETALEVIPVELIAESIEPARPSTIAESTPFVPPPNHVHPYPVPFDHDARPHDPSLVHLPVSAERAPDAVAMAPAEDATPARFTMTVGRQVGESAPSTSNAPKDGAFDAPGSDDQPLPESGVTTPARLMGTMAPPYPPAARAEEVEADVVLVIVVNRGGIVTDARVSKPAGFGFDEAALRAIRAARFAPAQRDGKAIAVRMHWSVAFRLR